MAEGEKVRRIAFEPVIHNSKRTILGELNSKTDEAEFLPKSQTSKEIMSVPMVDIHLVKHSGTGNATMR